jgi:hypothetical protein
MDHCPCNEVCAKGWKDVHFDPKMRGRVELRLDGDLERPGVASLDDSAELNSVAAQR